MSDPDRLLYMRARYYNFYISRFLSPDPRGLSGGFNFHLLCDGNPISDADPFGLYGNATAYWADLSVTGSSWQQAIAWPLGILSAIVPDAVAMSVSGTGGFIGGGTVGVQSVGYMQQGTGASYSFVGMTEGPQGSQAGFVTPQLSIGITISVAWSGEYNPSPSTWTGSFTEASFGEGLLGINSFSSDTWTGIGMGGSVGPVPVTASYFSTVDYQFLSPQGAGSQPQGVNGPSSQGANNSPIGK